MSNATIRKEHGNTNESGQSDKGAGDFLDKGKETATNILSSVGPAIKDGYEKTEKAVGSAIDATSSTIKTHP